MNAAVPALSRDERFELAYYFETLKSLLPARIADDACWDVADDGVVFADWPAVLVTAQRGLPLSAPEHPEHAVWTDFLVWLDRLGLTGRLAVEAPVPRLIIGLPGPAEA